MCYGKLSEWSLCHSHVLTLYFGCHAYSLSVSVVCVQHSSAWLSSDTQTFDPSVSTMGSFLLAQVCLFSHFGAYSLPNRTVTMPNGTVWAGVYDVGLVKHAGNGIRNRFNCSIHRLSWFPKAFGCRGFMTLLSHISIKQCSLLYFSTIVFFDCQNVQMVPPLLLCTTFRFTNNSEWCIKNTNCKRVQNC